MYVNIKYYIIECKLQEIECLDMWTPTWASWNFENFFPRFKKYIFLIFLQTAMGYCIKLDVKKVIAHHEAQEKQQQSGLAMIQVLIEKKK